MVLKGGGFNSNTLVVHLFINDRTETQFSASFCLSRFIGKSIHSSRSFSELFMSVGMSVAQNQYDETLVSAMQREHSWEFVLVLGMGGR